MMDLCTQASTPNKSWLLKFPSCCLTNMPSLIQLLVVTWYFEKVRVRSHLLKWACSLSVDVALKIVECLGLEKS